MEAMATPIRVALIGYGYVGETFHAPLIAAIDGLDLAVVSSSKPDKVHARYPNARVTATPEEAITDRSVDLVVVASPNTSHVPLCTLALEAGKHVVCDKPFTITAQEARDLATLAAAKNLVLSVFHDRRYDGDFLTLKQLIADDTLGPINYFESHFDRFRPAVRQRWREGAGEGAGLWYDLGPHLLDQALVLFGPPETIQASIQTQRTGGLSDDYAHVVLGYGAASGIRATALQVTLHASLLAAGGWSRFLVHGNKASWFKRGLDQQETQLLRGMKPEDPGWGIDPDDGLLFHGAVSNIPGTAQTTTAPEKVPNQLGCYDQYYVGVRDAILGTGPNPVPPADAVLVMEALEAAIESARTGCRVTFRS
jgi:predicted dehydrogenase